MARYVALLGSINVGGNRLRMVDLRAAFEADGFTAVETVVSSGNVLFDHETRPTPGLEEKLAMLMHDRFGMTSVVAVRGRDELAAAIAGNPFAQTGDAALVHTQFLAGQPTQDQFDALIADHRGRGRERIAPGDRSLHIDYVDGVAASRLTGDFIARRLGYKGTARNVRSIARMIAKLDEQAGDVP